MWGLMLWRCGKLGNAGIINDTAIKSPNYTPFTITVPFDHILTFCHLFC